MRSWLGDLGLWLMSSARKPCEEIDFSKCDCDIRDEEFCVTCGQSWEPGYAVPCNRVVIDGA
jgi:hypothetical protein